MTGSVLCAILWYYLGNVGLSLCTVDAFGKSLITLMNFGPVGAPPSEKKIKKYFWLGALLLQNYNTILYDARGQNPPPP